MLKHLFLMIAVALFAMPLAIAQAPPIQQTAYESVVESTDVLLAKLTEVKPIYEEDPQRFYREVQLALDPYVDFKGFAKRVMAKHYRKANDSQRERFVLEFKQSLIDTYATALLEFDNQKVVVLPPTSADDGETAVILVEVHAKSGAVYPVHYQLELINDRWLLRNVIINGINMGLQFRSQFNAYMQKYRQDLDLVIANWSVDGDDQD